MNLTVETPDPGAPTGWSATEMEPEALAAEVRNHCFDVVTGSPTFNGCVNGSTTPDCNQEVCETQVDLCAANLLLEMSRAVAPTDIETGQTTYRVPPQTTAGNVGLASASVQRLSAAATGAGAILRAIGGSGTSSCAVANMATDVESADGEVQEKIGELLAGTLVEASASADVLADELLRDNSAVADTDLEADPNRGAARRTAFFAPVLSRAYGMQAVVGGITTGNLGVTYENRERAAIYSNPGTEGFCSTNCDEDCETARAIIVDAGPPPGDVYDDGVDEDGLLDGSGASDGGLIDRIAERYGDPEIANDTPDEFLERYGIDREDLARARRHLGEEAAAFDRNLDTETRRPVLVTDDPSAPPVESTYTYYAATTRRPTALPAIYHVEMGRSDPAIAEAGDRDTGGTFALGDSAYPTHSTIRSVTSLHDYVESVAYHLLDAGALQDEATYGHAEDMAGVLLAERQLADANRVEVCYRKANKYDHELRVRVHGIEPTRPVRLVLGTSGLVCAETGMVEGEPCDLDDHVASGVTATTGLNTEPLVGYDGYTQLDRVLVGSQRHYVVRLRAGASSEAAGSWQAMASTNPTFAANINSDWEYCHNEYFDEVIVAQAAAQMEVPPTHCGAGPVTDCVGKPIGLLPLEDELIEDSDPYENSFRHHARVAREAAEYADELGERLIEQGLTMDAQAEQAVRNISATCGGEFNLDDLFTPTGAGGRATLDDVVSGDCPCSSSYSCVAGRCVLRVLVDASLGEEDSRALAECLGGDETLEPLVTLGTTPYCFWHDIDASNVLCDGADDSNPCPIRAERTFGVWGCPGMAPPAGNSPSVIMSEPLGLVGGVPGGPLAGTTHIAPIDCGRLRRLRSTTDEGEQIRLAALTVGSNFFAIDNVRTWAERIGWRGYPLDFSELTLDGGRWHGTGNPFPFLGGSGPTFSDWPCSSDPEIDCSAGTDSLFCAPAVNCSDPAARAVANDRMARAATFLAAFSGYGLGNLRLPSRYGGPGTPAVNWADFEGTAVLDDYRTPPQQWRVAMAGQWRNWEGGGLVAVPLSGSGQVVWRRPALGSPPPSNEGPPGSQLPAAESSTMARPVQFLNYGRAQHVPVDAATRAELVWAGMSSYSGASRLGTAYDPVASRGLVSQVVFDFMRSTTIPGRTFGRRGGYEDRHHELTQLWVDPVYGVDQDPAIAGVDDYDWNQLAVAASGYDYDGVHDALELMCEAARQHDEGQFCDPSYPPLVLSSADLPQLRSYLTCLSARVERVGERLTLQQLPLSTVRMIRGETGAVVPDAGVYGENVTLLRDSLRALASIPRSIAAQVRGFSDDLELLELALARHNVQGALQDLSTASGVISQAAACAASASNSQPGAVATCANAVAQTVIQLRVNELNHENLTLEEEELIVRFRGQFAARQEVLQQLSEQIVDESENANRALNALGTARRSASRSLAQAMFASSDSAGRHYATNLVMRRRYNTLRVRYQEAHQAAVRYAILARRSLEQRLGTDITDLHDLPLVDDPRTWAGSACETTGIDYSRIRDTTQIGLHTHADDFIGDYVRRLERVLESYRLRYPYVDGGDTAVISLRDDANLLRADCATRTYNLLASSGDPQNLAGLERDGSASTEEPAWGQQGCVGDPVEDCITVHPVADADLRVVGATSSDAVGGYRITFAPGTGSGFHSEANWGQNVPIAPGLYRVSWYGRSSGDAVGRDPATAVGVSVEDLGGAPSTADVGPVYDVETIAPGAGWSRFFFFVRIPVDGSARVGVLPDTLSSDPHSVDVAAMQLERLTPGLDWVSTAPGETTVNGDPDTYYPRAYVNTSARGFTVRPACEDTDGREFRQEWASSCEPLCRRGLGRCAPDEEPLGERCYHELDVWLDPTAVEEGRTLSRAGFAYGNFNYRVDRLGLNLVGTGVRNCEGSATPSTCNASGSVSYSIRHQPQYLVRNHAGEDYEAPLFLGRIEHGRALAAERYVTNPMSTADRSLVEPYMRREMRGRPLSGHFVVRIWDDEGFDWGAVEDVQFILDYRYLTRTSSPTGD